MNLEVKYFDVKIHNTSYCIYECASKPKDENSSFNTLTKIKKIIEENLTYSSDCKDSYSNLTEYQLLEILKEKSTEIYKGYQEKHSQSNWFSQIFFSYEKEVSALYSRINYTYPVPLWRVLPLPDEITQKIVQQLNFSSLRIFTQLNRSGHVHATKAILKYAQDLGYGGNNPLAAGDYTKKLFCEIGRLFTENITLPKILAYKEKKISAEKILANFQTIEARDFFTILCTTGLYATKTFYTWSYGYTGNIIVHTHSQLTFNHFHQFLTNYLKEHLSKQTSKLIEIDICNTDGDTALMLAAWRGQKKMVQILLEHGANIHLVSNVGYTALSLAIEEGHKEIVELLSFSERA